MGQVSDLPLYQASLSPAQHSLNDGFADVKQVSKCKHKCMVSRTGYWLLFAMIVTLGIGYALLAKNQIEHEKHHARPTYSMAELSKRVPAPYPMITAPGLTANGYDEPTFTEKQMLEVPWYTSSVSPKHTVQFVAAAAITETMTATSMSTATDTFTATSMSTATDTFTATSTTTFTSTSTSTSQSIATVILTSVATKTSTATSTPIPTYPPSCATESDARLCVSLGFDCVNEGKNGAPPVCMKRKPEKEAQEHARSRKNKLIGGIVGGVIGLFLLLGALWALWRRKCHKDLANGRAPPTA